ncbi:MAG TPA: hypothetical protein DC048_15755 [Planctomycetaceae bacterium]|nr:hypothetical protein [Planctomycetaceae bacterium]
MGDPTTFGGAPLDAASLAIVEEFESAWEHGRPDVATFFSRHAGRPTRLLVELAAIDLENRLKRGDAAAVADYTGRFPELATDAVLIQELSRVAERFAARAAADTPNSAIGESAGDGGGFGLPLAADHRAAASREASLVGSRIGGVSKR